MSKFKKGGVHSSPRQTSKAGEFGGGEYVSIDGSLLFCGESFHAREMATFLAEAPAAIQLLEKIDAMLPKGSIGLPANHRDPRAELPSCEIKLRLDMIYELRELLARANMTRAE